MTTAYANEADARIPKDYDELIEYLEDNGVPEESIKETKYLHLLNIIEEKNYEEALPILLELGDYKDCNEIFSKAKSEFYNLGLALMTNGEVDEAIKYFEQTKDYERTDVYLKYLKRYQSEKHKNILKNEDIVEAGESWFLYRLDDCYVYVPIFLDKSVKCGIYFPGGYGGDMLFRDGMYTYIKKYTPKSIIIFYISSGYTCINDASDRAYEILKDVTHQEDVIIKEIVTMGSSMGSFSALHASAYLYDKYGLISSGVVSLDAGLNWVVDRPLKDEEYDLLKEQETDLYLFEQYHTGDKHFDAIEKFIQKDSPTYIIECANGDHDAITVDGFKYGAMSWAFGEFEVLDEVHYNLVKLN